jgi:hypothetical protein
VTIFYIIRTKPQNKDKKNRRGKMKRRKNAGNSSIKNIKKVLIRSIILFLIISILSKNNLLIFETNGIHIQKELLEIKNNKDTKTPFSKEINFIKPNVHQIGPEQYMNPAADSSRSYAYNYGYWVGTHLANNYTIQNLGFRNTLAVNSYKNVEDALENLSIFKNLQNPKINQYESEYINFYTDLLNGVRNALKKYEGDNVPPGPTRKLFNNQCTTTISTDSDVLSL